MMKRCIFSNYMKALVEEKKVNKFRSRSVWSLVCISVPLVSAGGFSCNGYKIRPPGLLHLCLDCVVDPCVFNVCILFSVTSVHGLMY